MLVCTTEKQQAVIWAAKVSENMKKEILDGVTGYLERRMHSFLVIAKKKHGQPNDFSMIWKMRDWRR